MAGSSHRHARLLTPPITIITDALPVETRHQSHVRTASDATRLSLPAPLSPTSNSMDGETLRSRANSFLSDVGTTRSRGNSDLGAARPRFEGDELTSAEALRPDQDDESDFEVPDNPFAFTPGHLNKLLNPKSLAAFKALGGIRGLERGLKTDLLAGLSVDETAIGEPITFEDATATFKNKSILDGNILRENEGPPTDPAPAGQYGDRTRVFGDNRIPKQDSVSIWTLFWNAYNDNILLLLTAAAVISLALGIYEAVGQPRMPGEPQSVDWVEGLAIMIAIVIVVFVTGLNDYRREKQFSKLNERKDDRQVKAVRSGKSVLISVYDVLVGDVLHLESGDSIPADGVLISGHGIACDESSATGESDAMKKTTGHEVWRKLQDCTATSKLDPFIISGSKVLEGVGTFLVTSTGVNSSHGKIMMSLRTETEQTPLQVKLGDLAKWIGYIGTTAAALLFFVLLIRFLATLSTNTKSPAKKGSQFLDILIVAVTIIVVAVPEGLPLSVTLALSFATKRMYKENNLVRHLRACETMGNATTICSDKTGTLTQNKMTVVAGAFGSGAKFAREVGLDDVDNEKAITFAAAFERLSPAAKNLLLQSITINSTAFDGEADGENTFIGSKTETALLTLAKEQLGMGPVAEERAGVEILQLFPFDSNRKCMGAVVRLASGSYRLLVKGAAEIMLSKATKQLHDTFGRGLEDENMTEVSRSKVSATISEYAKQSLRTIGMLYRDFPQWPPMGALPLADSKSDVSFDDVCCDMTFVAVVGIQDPLRPGVPEAVALCQRAGIIVRMVTGDNALTATAIATQCGIKTPSGLVMEGPHFRNLPTAELDAILPNLQVLARSSPEDKRLLVSRLKALGETVAVTGDGTNDAPALKTADIGFSMGIAGTEVAKEASSIILLDDNFTSIIKAIMWGRSVNDAVSKFLQFQITVNITAVILAFVSAVASPSSRSVLSAVQLLWVNLIMDTFAALALATDAPTEKILERAPVKKSAALITTNMWKMIVGQAVYQLIVTFVLYFRGADILGYDVSDAGGLQQTQLNTIVFNTFVWMQIFNEFNNRRLDNRLNIFEGMLRNYFFITINAVMIGGQILIIFFGGLAFQITPLDGVQWAICILCALPCLLWAVALRCIPDKWAQMLFHWVGVVCFGVWRPIGAGLRAVVSSVAKAGRATGRVGRKAKETAPMDEEEKIGKAEERQRHVGGLPPITLTTA